MDALLYYQEKISMLMRGFRNGRTNSPLHSTNFTDEVRTDARKRAFGSRSRITNYHSSSPFRVPFQGSLGQGSSTTWVYFALIFSISLKEMNRVAKEKPVSAATAVAAKRVRKEGLLSCQIRETIHPTFGWFHYYSKQCTDPFIIQMEGEGPNPPPFGTP